MAGFDRQEQKATATQDHTPSATVDDAAPAGPTTQFTSAGTVPPVDTAASQAAGPSASDRAFGAHETGSSPHSFTGPAHLRVTADGLNVRSSPNAGTKDNIVGGVHHGDHLESDGRDGDWVCVTFHGQRAFVHGRYVEAMPAQVAPEVAQKPEKVVEVAKEAAEKPTHAAAPDVAVTPAAPSPIPMPYPTVNGHEAPAAAPKAGKHIEPHAPAAHAQTDAPAAAPSAPAAATTVPAAPKHADPALVRAEYHMLVATARTGFLTTPAAIESFINFDREHNGGQMSPTGLELLATMPFDIAQQQVAQVNEKVPVKHEATPPTAPSTTAPAEHDVAAKPAAPAQGPTAAAHAASEQAQGQAPTFTPPADAHLDDAELARLGAELNDAHATKALTDLAGVTALAKKLGKHLSAKEYSGPDRENFVAGIAEVRKDLQALAGGNPKVEQFKVAVNHKLEALSPYHSQINMRTIETGKFTTCNVTSLAMSLETIGKNASNYKESKRGHLMAVAQKFHGDVASAKNTSHGNEVTWASLAGLRLPDFMELAAVATNIHSDHPSDSEMQAAVDTALTTKTHIDFLAKVARDFGAESSYHTMSFGGHASDLAKFAIQQHAMTDVLADARNTAEAEPNNKEAQQDYESLRAKQQPRIEGPGATIEKNLPLEQYKAAVMAEIKPLLDSGAGVVSGTFNHFTHCYEVTENHIKVQDPGQFTRSDRKLLWPEARALQYFWNYVVVK